MFVFAFSSFTYWCMDKDNIYLYIYRLIYGKIYKNFIFVHFFSPNKWCINSLRNVLWYLNTTRQHYLYFYCLINSHCFPDCFKSNECSQFRSRIFFQIIYSGLHDPHVSGVAIYMAVVRKNYYLFMCCDVLAIFVLSSKCFSKFIRVNKMCLIPLSTT